MESLRVQEEETDQQVLALPRKPWGAGMRHGCALCIEPLIWTGECNFGLWTPTFSEPFTSGPAGFELQDTMERTRGAMRCTKSEPVYVLATCLHPSLTEA